MSNAWIDAQQNKGAGIVRHRIGEWADDFARYAVVITIELRIGDLGGDLASRGFMTTDHEPVSSGVLTASFTYDLLEGRGRWRNVGGGAGVPSAVREVTDFAEGWTSERAERLAELAERWHLNTMQGACAHMTPLPHVGYEPEEQQPYLLVMPTLDGSAVPLARVERYVTRTDLSLPYGWNEVDGLFTCDANTAMLGRLGCAAGTGYSYGKAWLVEPLPDTVLSELVNSFGAQLPPSSKENPT